METIKKYLILSLGLISLILGFIGIFFPILPTTPFLLLASLCFVRSSSRLYNWLIHHKIFGEYIYNYMQYRAIKRKVKIRAIILLWISLTLSIFIVHPTYLKLLLIGIGIAVSLYIASLKTLELIKKEEHLDDFQKNI